MWSAGSGRHQASTDTGTRRRAALTIGVAVLAAAAGALVAVSDTGGSATSHAGRTVVDRPAMSSQPPSSSTGTSDMLQTPIDPPATTAPAGVPVRVTVARAGIDTALDRVGLTRGGSLQTPRSFVRAAWFAGGVRPGDLGPAVIAGHVDSRTGPAVFFRLDRVRRGDRIDVRDRDGVLRAFVVTAVRRYAKAAFGTAQVYGPTVRPELRLITCTGVFDPAAGSYRDNLVVFATLRGPRAG